MSNPLVLRDVKYSANAFMDYVAHASDCFIYHNHSEMAVHNARSVATGNDPTEDNNVFSIYDTRERFIGVTGLWCSDIPELKDMAFLRWTGIRNVYRGLRLNRYILELLQDVAYWRHKKIVLVEIAHTERAAAIFERCGFELIDNNEKYIQPLLKLLGEELGSFILIKPIHEELTESHPIDWEAIYKRAQ